MIVRLETLSGAGSHIAHIPRSLAARLGIKGRQSIDVHVGQAKVRAACSASSMQSTIAMSESLLGSLSLRRGLRLHARAANGELHIGPLVGILVPGMRGGANPVGNMTLEMRYFLEQGRIAGVYPFVFACSSVDLAKGTVRGYTLARGTYGYTWARRTFPLPDVVYDHITYRRRDRSSDIRKLRQRLAELHIPVFNSGYFDKWDVHNWLSQCEALRPHLPETQQLSVEALDDMCRRYQRVFVKPSQGSLGRNIAVITKLEKGDFEFRRTRRSSPRLTVTDVTGLPAKLPKLSHDYYLVQQGLDLCRAHGRRRDIRVIMQRNGSGRWLMTKIFARIAPSGQLVSNITAGATGAPVGRSLRRCFSAGRVAHILREIRRVSRLVCKTLAEMHEYVGELGIDLGVDTRGHVWIIEVNSKPHRKAYDTLEGMPGAQRSFRRPLQYAAHLAGFQS